MGEFFWGWKRKTGVVTLVMACVFMGGWVRGLMIVDQIHFLRDSQTMHTLLSCPFGFGWTTIHETGDTPLFKKPINPLSRQTLAPGHYNAAYPPIWKTKRGGSHWTGFRSITYVSQLPPSNQEIRIWIIPQWSIAVPLTLLSALLILSPRKSHESKIAGSTDAE